MNKQTRRLRTLGRGTRILKGATGERRTTSAMEMIDVEIVKGRCVDSSGERKAAGRKPWKGAGNPLNR